MKLLGLILMFVSSFWVSVCYIESLKKQLLFLKDWEKIFRCWQDWIDRFSYSVQELLDHTVSDLITHNLSIVQKMDGKDYGEFLEYLEREDEIAKEDKKFVCQVLKELGSSSVQGEVASLAHCQAVLREKIKEREKTVKERSMLIYKLVPLLCGALAVILW